MIERKEYLDRLIRFRDKELIKVVTGIRRCGKSTLFLLYQAYLRQQGVSASHIISLNLEAGECLHIKSAEQLYALVLESLEENGMNYIFLDEVQVVPNFQRTVDALYIKHNCDVYITGSNAYLLSGELATLLSGRYIEIHMLPLSFKEYVLASGSDLAADRLYQQYITYGGFPFTLRLESQRDRLDYLNNVYDTVVLKDIMFHRAIADVQVLRNVMNFLFDNVGNLASTKKITDTLKAEGLSISVNTVEGFLTAFVDSYAFYRAGRFDVKGRQYLRTGNKYYAADLGLRRSVLGPKAADHGHVLENIVYLELIRRGYEVFVGKVDQSEIDFIAFSHDGVEYYQVAYTLIDPDGSTLKYELAPLSAVRDHYPKYLLTMDLGEPVSHNGIRQINVLTWLMGEEPRTTGR